MGKNEKRDDDSNRRDPTIKARISELDFLNINQKNHSMTANGWFWLADELFSDVRFG